MKSQTPKKPNILTPKKYITKSKKFFLLSKNILSKKYSQYEYSFTYYCTNYLIFNEKCLIVARFKDYLVYDDSTEFIRRFYHKKELHSRLKKIFNFYESYCKIFPNYMILPESKFLYRNIRKKQKMIDAFNEIKKEEEENRKHLKIGLNSDKKKHENVVFTKKIQESIERYHPSLSNILSNTFMSEINSNNNNNLNNEFDFNDKSIITISLNSQRPLNFTEINNFSPKHVKDFEKFFTPNRASFAEKNFNDMQNNSQNSIFKIVQILNDNKNINDNIQYLNNDNTDNGDSINNNIKNKPDKKEIKINNININNNGRKKNLKNDSNNIKMTDNKKNLNNANTKRKFISHKQTISVPLASNMLNNNTNNILEEEEDAIKFINKINNIIISKDKNNTINNGMIININNNYFELKDSKKEIRNKIKRVKSKDEQKREKSKKNNNNNNKIKPHQNKENKTNNFEKIKIFREKRTYTTYNAQNVEKKNKKFLINETQSPNNKKGKFQNTEKKKNISSTNYILTMTNSNNNSKQITSSNIYRNTNYLNDKRDSKKLIESKTLFTSPNTINKQTHTKDPRTKSKTKKPKNNNINNIINNHIIAMTEANTTITPSSYNQSKISNKLKIINKNEKELPKLEGVESVDKKKLSLNRKIVNNYLTMTQKKKTYQGRFQVKENSVSNNFNNKTKLEENNNINNNTKEKLELLNIHNTLEKENNPIKFKLNQKDLIKKKKTNSLQINNKNEFLSSFNLPQKEKANKNNINIDVVNIEENMSKYRKKSIKKLITNYKTQTNSEVELIKDINNIISKKNNLLNTITNKSAKKDNINKKMKLNNNNTNSNMTITSTTNNHKNNNAKNEIRKINVKEMKEKYHKLIRGNKFNHGSYDIANRIPLFTKIKSLNTIIDNMTNNINNTIITNNIKRSPLLKKSILSPSERITNVSNYIKTPTKMRHEDGNKEYTTIEVTNNMYKFRLIGNDKNKQIDSNNKKMKFLKK